MEAIACAEGAQGRGERRAHQPGLGLAAAEDLIGPEEIQSLEPWPLLKHVDTGKPPADASGLPAGAGFTSSRFWTVLGGEPHMCSSALSKRRKPDHPNSMAVQSHDLQPCSISNGIFSKICVRQGQTCSFLFCLRTDHLPPSKWL